MSALYAWLRRHPLLVDSVLAGMLALLSVTQVVHDPAVQIPIAVLMLAPVAVRRKATDTAFAIAALAGLLQLVVDQPASGALMQRTAGPRASDLAILVLLYSVAAYRPRRHSVTALIVCLIGTSVATLTWFPTPGPHQIAQLAFAAALLAGTALLAWVLGDSMHYRRGYYIALEDRAARLEAERDAQSKIAAAAERARIARELHDVVAHHVSVMVVQADGARYALRADPDRADHALAAIAGTGRQALTEMRRLLGVLRSAGEQSGLAPVPGLGEVRELLDQARAAGLEVSYTLSGTPRDLPEGVELAAYRVVQESLTNTRKHGGPAATAAVALRYGTGCLTVEVTDDGLGLTGDSTPGHGLAGMRERIAMYGGTVQAGPLSGGGYRVVATLPCPPATAHPGAGRGQAPSDARLALSASAGPAAVNSADVNSAGVNSAAEAS